MATTESETSASVTGNLDVDVSSCRGSFDVIDIVTSTDPGFGGGSSDTSGGAVPATAVPSTPPSLSNIEREVIAKMDTIPRPGEDKWDVYGRNIAQLIASIHEDELDQIELAAKVLKKIATDAANGDTLSPLL